MAVYDQAAQDYVGRLIQQFTGGLVPSSVGVVWLSVENGDNNNPFGVTGRTASGGQYLIQYPTLADGVRAAAQLLLTSPTYASTRRALEAARGNPAAAGQAIVESPWNRPYYATKLVPKLLAAGLWPGGTSTSSSGMASTGSGTLAEWLGKKPSEPFTKGDLARLVDGYHSVGFGAIVELKLVPLLRVYVGHPISSLPTSIKIDSQHPAVSVVPRSAQSEVTDAVGGLFGDLFGWVPSFAVNGAILVTILVLGYVGIRRVAG